MSSRICFHLYSYVRSIFCYDGNNDNLRHLGQDLRPTSVPHGASSEEPGATIVEHKANAVRPDGNLAADSRRFLKNTWRL